AGAGTTDCISLVHPAAASDAGPLCAHPRQVRLVIFGLTVSSSWGNGHATHWRSIIRALARRGHEVTFFERNVPYYARHRDLHALPGATLVLYPDWEAVEPSARRAVQAA